MTGESLSALTDHHVHLEGVRVHHHETKERTLSKDLKKDPFLPRETLAHSPAAYRDCSSIVLYGVVHSVYGVLSKPVTLTEWPFVHMVGGLVELWKNTLQARQQVWVVHVTQSTFIAVYLFH